MSGEVTALVSCVHGGRHLARTLETLWSEPSVEVVVLSPPGLSDREGRCIDAIVARGPVRRLEQQHHSLAAGWNEALGSTTADAFFCLNEGQWLEPGYVAAASRALEDERVAWVCPWRRRHFANGEVALVAVESLDPVDLWPNLDALCTASVIRRRDFERSGGFDTTFGHFGHVDLWLRMATDRSAVVLDHPWIAELVRPSSRPSLDPGEDVARRLAERHAAHLVGHVPRVFGRFAQRFAMALDTHRALVARRNDAVAELAALDSELENICRELTRLGRASVDFGDFRRVDPTSCNWGYDRQTPADRPYIEAFLARHALDIRGRVLEVQENDYTVRFGGDRVEKSDVLDITPQNPNATLFADLRCAPSLESDAYDCFILTQTLHLIDDMEAALREARRILRPGGVLLATFPAASRLCVEYGSDRDFWRVTEAGARTLFARAFRDDTVEVHSAGNVLTHLAFLHGLAAEELTDAEYSQRDPAHPLLITVRAVKAGGPDGPKMTTSRRRQTGDDVAGVILRYHRIDRPKSDVYRLSISPETFREHVKLLRQEFEPVSLDELTASLAAGRAIPRAVAVTFDDGYLDNLVHASPLLSELNVPATFFVTSATKEYWWDALERVLLCTFDLPRELSIAVGGRHHRFETASPVERGAAFNVLYPLLRAAPLDERNAAIATLLAWAGDDHGDITARPLRPEELVRLAARRGHSIGSHTRNHLALTAQSREVRLAELQEGRRALEELLRQSVRSVAYPFGEVDDNCIEDARNTGFTVGVTCEHRAVRLGEDWLGLPRLETPKDVNALRAMLLAELTSAQRRIA